MTKITNRRMGAFSAAAGAVALSVGTAAMAKNWGDWYAPANLNALSTPDINTAAVDGCASSSRDGLTIVFNSNRAGTQDLYMATRESESDDFGPAVRLPAPVNLTDKHESCPTIAQGKRLYFASNRDDPAYDLYVTRLGSDGDWSEPEGLGPNINTPGVMEEAPDFYEDEAGRQVMIFTRRAAVGLAGHGGKIFESVDGGEAVEIEGEPNGTEGDNRASISKDGLVIYWDSVRGGKAMPDLYYATRSSTSEPFGEAIPLTDLSGPGFDARPFISWDNSFLTYSSGRAGNVSPAPDIWYSSRDKVTGQD